MKAFAFIALALLAGCAGGMAPEVYQASLDALEAMRQRGSITADEFLALKSSLDVAAAPRSFDWVGETVQTVLVLAGAYLGIRVSRGPVATPQERVTRKVAQR